MYFKKLDWVLNGSILFLVAAGLLAIAIGITHVMYADHRRSASNAPGGRRTDP